MNVVLQIDDPPFAAVPDLHALDQLAQMADGLVADQRVRDGLAEGGDILAVDVGEV